MSELVFLRDGIAVTTSLLVAKGVQVEHRAVLQLIRKYIPDFETFGSLIFETVKGKALPQGGFAKSTEIAILNEQQATLLVTYCKNTEVVRRFKVALVKAFYEARQTQLTVTTGDTLTPAQQHQIQTAVAARAQKTAHNYQTIYRALKNRFQVARYDQIPQSQFKEALRFIQSVDLSVPETSESTGEIFYYNARTLSEHELRALANLIYLRELGKPTFSQVYKGLRSLNSELAPRFYSLIAEGDFPAAALKNVLSRNQMDFTRPIR